MRLKDGQKCDDAGEFGGGYGTGSKPLPPQGWQRSMRRTASQRPFIGPCFFNASSAYCEHVGVKRQHAGFSGEIHT